MCHCEHMLRADLICHLSAIGSYWDFRYTMWFVRKIDVLCTLSLLQSSPLLYVRRRFLVLVAIGLFTLGEVKCQSNFEDTTSFLVVDEKG